MRVDEVCERLWPGRETRVEPLGGGITNHNFLVDGRRRAFVLRVGGKDTDLLGIDRRVEHGAALVAAAARRRAEVVAFVEPEGYLVTRFVEGSRSGRRAARRRRSAASRRRCARSTTGRRSPAASTPSGSSRHTPRPRLARGVPRARRLHGARRRSRDRIEAALGSARRAPLPQRPPERELHRRRRPPLAPRLGVRGHERPLLRPRRTSPPTTSSTRTGERAARGLLRRADAATAARLALMRFMSDFREAMWGVVQQAISRARRRLRRLRRRALRPARCERVARPITVGCSPTPLADAEPETRADRAQIVIVGAGVARRVHRAGTRRRGCADVVVLERADPTSGSTFHSAGPRRPAPSSPRLTRMMMRSVDVYRTLERRGRAVEPGWREVGSLRIASTDGAHGGAAAPARLGEDVRPARWSSCRRARRTSASR